MPQPAPSFDWLGVFWIPLAMTVIVGGALSVYLAFVVNRLAAFRQIRLSAITELAMFRKAIIETENAFKASIIVRSFAETQVIALASEEQWKAAATLKTIRKNWREHFKSEFDNAGRNLGHGKRDELKGEEWLKVQDDIHKKSQLVYRESVKQIQDMRPEILRILGCIPSNQTLNRWENHGAGRVLSRAFGWLSSSPERFKAFQAYCRGETEDF